MQVLTDPLRLYLNIYTFSVDYSNVRRHTECTTNMLALQSSCLCAYALQLRHRASARVN